MTTTNSLDALLDKMWSDYATLNPQALKIHDLFLEEGNEVINDHIALRTFNDSRVNIAIIAKPFLASGYIDSGDYHFKEKKLFAKHFQHPDPLKPKVFISELKLEEFSDGFREIVNKLLSQIPEKLTDNFDFSISGTPWNVSFKEYEELRLESEYGAWMSAFGYRANHFTVSLNHLSSHTDLEQLNQFILKAGYKLNESGGSIKGSPEVLLEQSSTLADQVKVSFSDSIQTIPACYYEFAKRYPMNNGAMYQGFVAASADKIFESTDKQ